MRLAIADPPYLGRADRWYGEGRGSGRTTGPNARGRNGRKPDHHPEAAAWDDPAAHTQLVQQLTEQYDGWAIAGHATTTQLLLTAAPPTARLAIWVRPNAMPGGSRLINTWEPVVVHIPRGRAAREDNMQVRDALIAPVRMQGFLGSKPPEWTRWVLAMLGYDPHTDTVVDIFPGSGAVQRASDGMLMG